MSNESSTAATPTSPTHRRAIEVLVQLAEAGQATMGELEEDAAARTARALTLLSRTGLARFDRSAMCWVPTHAGRRAAVVIRER